MLLFLCITVALACHPPLPNGDHSGESTPKPSSNASATLAPVPTNSTEDPRARVLVDTTIAWSDDVADQEAAKIPIQTQLSALQSVLVRGTPTITGVEHAGNGTRIVGEIGWAGTETQLRALLEDAFRYNDLLTGFEIEMAE